MPFKMRPMKVLRQLRSVAASVLVCLLLLPADPARAAELTLGAVLSRSGKFHAPSEMMENAYRLWEKQVNARGGLLGRPVRLILYDDQSNKDLVKQLYEKLIVQDRVDLILSPYGTTQTLAASEVTERLGYFMLAAAASGEKLWEREHRFIAGVHAVSGRYFIGFLDLIARNGLESVSVIYENSEFNISAAQGVRNWAPKFGLNLKTFRSFTDGEKELLPLLNEVVTHHPDALIFSSYPPDGYRLLSLMDETGYRPRALAMSITPALPDFAKRTGELSERVFGPSQWEADARLPFPGTVQFIKAFTQFAGKPPSYHAGAAYASCEILEKAITQTRSFDQKTIRDYVLSLDTVTVIGRFKVEYSGMQIGHDMILIQWQEGKKEIVYPFSMKTADPRFGTHPKSAPARPGK